MTNTRVLLDKDLATFHKQCPDYTLCQTVFAILQILRPDGWTKEDLLSITDEELYKATITAMIREREDN